MWWNIILPASASSDLSTARSFYIQYLSPDELLTLLSPHGWLTQFSWPWSQATQIFHYRSDSWDVEIVFNPLWCPVPVPVTTYPAVSPVEWRAVSLCLPWPGSSTTPGLGPSLQFTERCWQWPAWLWVVWQGSELQISDYEASQQWSPSPVESRSVKDPGDPAISSSCPRVSVLWWRCQARWARRWWGSSWGEQSQRRWRGLLPVLD